MKLLKSLFRLILIAVIGVALITLCPTKEEFVEYYISHNRRSELGGFFEDAYAEIIMQRTNAKEYLVFSVFEIDGKDRYVGILGHFFGRSSAEEAAQVMSDLLDQLRQAPDNDT